MGRAILTGITAVLLASSAMAAVNSFALPSETSFLPGESKDIMVSVDTAGATDALVLFAEVTGAFEVTGLEMIQGTVFQDNNTGLTVDIYDPKIGYGSVSTLSGNVQVGPGLALAYVTVKALGQDGDTGTISTESIDGASELGFANQGIAQATGLLKIVPEPASALLLLAGIPLLRRRTA